MSETPSQGRLVTRHRNHFLFSDYYLDHVVRDRPEWRAAEVEPTLGALAALWEREELRGASEAETEHVWVRPVLEALGHTFGVQVSIRTPLGAKKPDYVLFADGESRDRARAADGPLSEAELVDALAVADAKAWDLGLDQPISARQQERGLRTSENPSFQIDFYVRHAGTAWGVLTNGRLWRLVHRDSSKRLDVFYEVDLPALIEQATAPGAPPDAVDDFKYFLLFFRREAFSGAPSWLESVLADSRDYSQGVSENLKGQVYDALRELAQGFLDFSGNDLAPTPENLKAIYDSCLILLYRLLFTLYAEDRGLLPLATNEAYLRAYSLKSIKTEIAEQLRRGTPAVASMDTLWPKLGALWQVIATGNAQLGVQAYDGGLFDPARHPFLERYRIGDLHLRQAIDLMARARDPKSGEREFVDYRDLEIRHLGSIYEGLLEYRLRVAEEDLVVGRAKGREVFAPAAGTEKEPAVRAGRAHLVTDKGERKASGSYYTPDYIVQYIVENTVGPVLGEVTAAHEDDPVALERAILGLNVLDPAMGSGHFLVAATDFIARHLVALGLASTEALRDEGELAYWRRRVAQACIYGVDLNPLAVELAKLSLWLATVAKDKPLSFLDHHLRVGNSLIGARVADLIVNPTAVEKGRRTKRRREEEAATEAGQLSMMTDSAFVARMSTATRFMSDVEALKGETLEEVHEAERIYLVTVRSVTERYRRLADVATSRHFGLDLDETVLAGLTHHILREGFEVPQYAGILAEAERIARERHFFHWGNLEFPEVFFDEHGRLDEEGGGFDAVVGNPPYAKISGPRPGGEYDYFKRSYRSAIFKIDSYALVLELAVGVLRDAGFYGFIVPNSFLTGTYFDGFRHMLLQQSKVDHLLLLHSDFVFRDAMLNPVLIIGSRSMGAPTTQVKLIDQGHGSLDMESVSTRILHVQDIEQTAAQGFSVVGGEQLDTIWRSLQARTRPYAEVGSVHLGLVLRSNDECLFTDPSDDHDQGILLGRDIDRYATPQPSYHFHYSPADIVGGTKNIEVYRATPRLLFQAIRNLSLRRRLVGTMLAQQTFTMGTIHNLIMRSENHNPFAVLSILNSNLMNSYYRDHFPEHRIKGRYIESLPIRRISFTTPPATRTALVADAHRLYEDFVTTADPAPLLAFTDEQLVAEPERSDVVHDVLAFLAERMIELHKERQRLEGAYDPFKYLDRGAGFVKLPEAFAEEIKYGQVVREPVDLGSVRHDIDGLRLEPAGDAWELQVHLKLRDPADGWASWQREPGGSGIARQWVSAYRLPLEARKARYYAQALPALREFEHARAFAGGKTQTTLRKLQAVGVPAFDGGVDLGPLTELAEELARVREAIARTDRLIDLVVYRLYGLTEEEVAVVEGRG